MVERLSPVQAIASVENYAYGRGTVRCFRWLGRPTALARLSLQATELQH